MLFFKNVRLKIVIFIKKIQQRWKNKCTLPYQDESQWKFPGEKKEKTPSLQKQFVLFWGIWLLFVILWAILYNTLSYVFMLIAAFICSLALETVIAFWARLTRSRGVGILIAYFLMVVFLLSGFFILVPFFLGRWTEILQSLVTFFQTVQGEIAEQGIEVYIRSISWMPESLGEEIIDYIQTSNAETILPTLTENMGKIINFSSSYLKLIGEYAVNIFWWFFWATGKVIIFFTLSIFFSISHFKVKYSIKYLFRNTEKFQEKVDEIYKSIENRLKSQLLLCVFIGIASYIGLNILSLIGYDIPQKGVLAILAGLFEIIPYLGPYLGLLPAAIFWIFFHGLWGFLAVVILYIIIQQSEEKILVPYLMSKTLWISPLLIFICMLIAGSIMGIVGIVFAVPLAVIVSIIFSIPSPQKHQEKLQKHHLETQKGSGLWMVSSPSKEKKEENSEETPVAKNLEQELLKNKFLQSEKKMKKAKETEKIKKQLYEI